MGLKWNRHDKKLYHLLHDAFNYRWPFERMKLAPREDVADDFIELMGHGWYYFQDKAYKKVVFGCIS